MALPAAVDRSGRNTVGEGRSDKAVVAFNNFCQKIVQGAHDATGLGVM